jgi:hypothetical protein
MAGQSHERPRRQSCQAGFELIITGFPFLRQYYRTALDGLLRRINAYPMRWAQRKYKRLRPFRKARTWWHELTARQPCKFTHWAWVNEF